MSRHREFRSRSVYGSFGSTIFTWKGAIFSPFCERSKLKINWYFPRVLVKTRSRSRKSRCVQESESDEDHDVEQSSDHEMHSDTDAESIFISKNPSYDDPHLRTKKDDNSNVGLKENVSIDHMSTKHGNNFACGSTEIDVFPEETNDERPLQSASIIRSGFSFDPGSCIRVPVILVALQVRTLQKTTSASGSHEGAFKDKLELTAKTYILFSLSEINTPSLIATLQSHQKHIETKILQETDTYHKKSFQLIPLRTFSSEELTYNSSLQKNIAFISNYRFLHVNIECGTMDLYYGSMHNTEAQVETFPWVNDKPKKCSIVLYDIYTCFETDTVVIIALMDKVNVDESQSRICAVMLFYPPQTISHHFELKRPEIKQFFPEEFSQILLSFSILSTKVSSRSAQVLSSSVIMISTTGYAIKFLNGEMTHCVQLTGSTELSVGSDMNVNIVNIEIDSKSNHQSAIHLNNTCDIVDWSQKKVSSSHRNVSFVSKYDRLGNGCQTFLLLLFPKSGIAAQKEDLCVEDHIPLTIDSTTTENDAGVLKYHSRQDATEENQKFGNVTQKVLEDLIFQEKKCQAELKEMEQVVRNKEIFIENMQQMFSNELSREHKLDSRNKNLQPLVPLIEESKLEEDLLISQRQFLKVGQMWKRVLDSQLICGLEVTNMSKTCHMCGMSLILIPTNPSSASLKCSSSISSKTSPSSSQLNAPLRKEMCLDTESNEIECNHTLKFRETASFMAYVDISHAIRGENVVFKVLLTYDALESYSRKLLTENICCGQFTVSVNDIVMESSSLKSRLCGHGRDTLDTEDILALDCIQRKCYDMEVSSIMTSVLALKSSLQLCPAVSHIIWADQFIINADLAFRYCRIKWLKQYSKHHAKIRVYTRSQTEALLLAQFLYNLVPKDITISLSHKCAQPSVSEIKDICQSLMDRVDDSIIQTEKTLSAIGQDGNQVSSGAKQNAAIPMEDGDNVEKADRNDNDEREFQPQSPTFPSSGPRRRKTFQTCTLPSTSTSKVAATEGTESSVSKLLHNRLDAVDPTNLFKSDTDSVRRKANDCVKPSGKGKSSRGGLSSKGKSRLMKKKS